MNDERPPLGEYDGTVLSAVAWKRTVLWWACAFCFFGAVCVLAAIPKRGPVEPLLTSVGFLAVGVPGVILGRSGLVISSDEVRWREKWQTRRWNWSEISGFDLAADADRLQASLKLTSGEMIPFRIRAGPGPAEAEKARKLVEDLRARLRFEQAAER